MDFFHHNSVSSAASHTLFHIPRSLAEITRLAEEVREAGVALDDGELTLIALNGLDATYETFITAQSARTDDIPFAAFQGLLQAHEERFGRHSLSTGIPMANAVTTEGITCPA